MIGDGWDDTPSVRPGEYEAPEPSAGLRRCAVVTGSRAEFGLLRSVMHAIAATEGLELAVVAAGSHLIAPAETFRDVKAEFNIAAIVPMQIAGRTGRLEDAESVARGIARFSRAFATLRPDWVVVLGDRIEAFAAAIAAAVAGFSLAHIHGGDRAEGVADEAMRHAITKLANLHFAASAQSADRILRMGEQAAHVHNVGSPAIDDLADIPALSPEEWSQLGGPRAVFLMHPIGRPAEVEEFAAAAALSSAVAAFGGKVLALAPNADPGREGVCRAIDNSGVTSLSHLPRRRFVALLKRIAQEGGLIIGNSSAALIECAALQLPAVDIGARQAGREHFANAVRVERETPEAIAAAITSALKLNRSGVTHGYGDGTAGRRIAEILRQTDPFVPSVRRKRNTY